ncbi:hypothetical protein RRG08_067269, partial [Elysia crispata]
YQICRDGNFLSRPGALLNISEQTSAYFLDHLRGHQQ